MGKLTPTRHPYLFGGGISGLLIAGAVFAFVSMVAVVSQTKLPGSPSAGSNLPHGDLTIGAGKGTVGEHAGPSSVTALLTAPASAHAPGAVSGPTTAASNRTEGPRGAHAGSSGPTGGTNSGAAPGPQHGGPTSGNPGQGGQPPPPGEGPSGPGPDKEAPTEGPPGLAKKPGGLPPGLAKKSDGRPPGLAKKPDGLPPGLAKKPGGLPPGHARH
jgi:hypothetical protein